MEKVKKIKRLLSQAIEMIYYSVLSKKCKDDKKYKDMWLISERGVEARDNGYVFFKYLIENHPEINAWYVINKENKKDFDRVNALGNIIEYGSLEHKIAFLLCSHAISTHTGYLEPWSYKLYKLVLDRKDEKFFVFLQHGVIMNDLSMYLNGSNKFDLFITTTKREYESLLGSNYAFKKGVVVQTGLARYDNLNEFKTEDHILLMPTWRMKITSPSYVKGGERNRDLFINSEYFKSLNSLINNKNLISLLESNKIKLIFYPHFEMQPYLEEFSIDSDYIVFADKNEYFVQDLLKNSKLMITDYSSVAIDFAYMQKPVLYYQKVKDDRYSDGYFDYKKDGYGEVVFDEEKLIDSLKYYFENGFEMKKEYSKRVDESFDIRDDKNCVRIYQKILDLKK